MEAHKLLSEIVLDLLSMLALHSLLKGNSTLLLTCETYKQNGIQDQQFTKNSMLDD